MSGIVGSKLNIRGSGLVGSLGTDGQHLLSAGAGVTNVFETVSASADYVKILSQTASDSAAIDFKHGTSNVVIDSTYKIYKFYFYNIAPATDDTQLQVLLSTDAGSTWDDISGGNIYGRFASGNNTTTSSAWSDGSVIGTIGSASDESANGEVTLFNPAGTVEHPMIQALCVSLGADNRETAYHSSFSHVAAENVDAVRFEMGSGNIASGSIVLYGIT